MMTTLLAASPKSKDPIGAIDRLAAALDSRDEAVRERTLKSLRELAASTDLGKVFEERRTPLKTRKNVLKAQRYLKEPKLTAVVVKALSDADAGVRADAALALSVFGAADAEGPLIAALGDAEKDVRYYAADALGACTSEAAKKAVAARLETEPDPTVRFALQQASKRP